MCAMATALHEMAQQVFDDPDVYVHGWYESRRAVPEATIAKAEARFGARLPDTLRAFYLEMDGFGLSWVHRDDYEDAREPLNLRVQFATSRRRKHKETEKRLVYPWTMDSMERAFDASSDVDHLDHRVTGMVRIPKFSHFVRHPAWSQFVKAVHSGSPDLTIDLDGESVRYDKAMKPFHVVDAYSASAQCFLYTGPGPRQMRVHRMSNHYEFYASDPHVPFDAYLEHLVKTRARLHERAALFD